MPPYLQVKDKHGKWTTVIEDMGMPAGKPKTIAVDLTGKFLSDSREVRIVTNLCVYWDEIFLSEDTAAPSVTQTVLSNAPPVWSSNELVENNTGTTGVIGSAANLVKGALATAGVVTASALLSVTMTVILQALPMIQALILLGIYALLPLVVVLHDGNRVTDSEQLLASARPSMRIPP